MRSGEKIPGYSGFIPFKRDHIGLTTGQSNQQAALNYLAIKDPMSNAARNIKDTHSKEFFAASRSMSVDGTNEGVQKKSAVGMNSKDSVTWVNGPNHEIRNQCIPGYTGFIAGVKAENVFAKSYANGTAKSFKDNITRGFNLNDQKRFQSTSKRMFNEKRNRRYLENTDVASKRDYLEYMVSLNNEPTAQETRMNMLRTHGSVNRFDKSYTDETGVTISPKKYKRDLNGSPLAYFANQVQVKPQILESKVCGSKEFDTLPESFKKIFTNKDKKDVGMSVPIVGYAGHRKGVTSENFFAKNYREGAMYGLKQKRAVRNSPNFFSKQ